MTKNEAKAPNVPQARRWLFWLLVGLIFFIFVFLIRSILLPFVLGIFTAYFLDPAADRLEKAGISRTLSTLIITAGFFLLIAVLSIAVVPVIINQLAGLIGALPELVAALDAKYHDRVTEWLGGLQIFPMDSVQAAVKDFSVVMVPMAEKFVSGLFQSGVAVLNILSLILITPVVAFYLLRDWDLITTKLDTLLPRGHVETIRQQLNIIDRTLAGFVRGQLTVCVLLGAFYAIGLSLVGLKFGILIGLGTGLLIILPYVGAMFGMVVGLGVAFFQFSTYQDVGMVLAVFMAGQALESYWMTPRLVGQSVGLHPVWIIFGMLAGGALFGFVGVFLAVPVTAVIGVLIRFAITNYLQSDYYHGEARAVAKSK